jgi:hypothetical protein
MPALCALPHSEAIAPTKPTAPASGRYATKRGTYRNTSGALVTAASAVAVAAVGHVVVVDEQQHIAAASPKRLKRGQTSWYHACIPASTSFERGLGSGGGAAT